MDKFTLFWGGPFSQWSSSCFKVDKVEYDTAEKWMMACKARLFKDEEMLLKIMGTSDPKTIKAYGKQVMDFKKEVWEEIQANGKPRCWNYVYRGSYAKYIQNPTLLQILYDTTGTELVEASPYDVIWGIGLGETDPKALDRSQWRGTNWLGEVLTQLREDLMTGRVWTGWNGLIDFVSVKEPYICLDKIPDVDKIPKII